VQLNPSLTQFFPCEATKRKARQTKSPVNEKPGVIAGLLASTNRLNNGVIERRLCRACLFKM
jgi:hypothetical protein